VHEPSSTHLFRAKDGAPLASQFTTRWTIIRALHGKEREAAWQWFVERYRPFVRGILAMTLPRPDLVQAAEEEFWGYAWMSGALQRADGERRFRAFLSGVVRNFGRAFSRKRGLLVADEASLATVRADDGTRSEINLWVENVVSNALTALRAEHTGMAQAVMLFYGLSPEPRQSRPLTAAEVATSMGNTTQGVYMLLFRGRKRLRKLVEEELREGCGDAQTLTEELQALLGIASANVPGLLAVGPW
jgi:DNA-directed RNA polymerase specialized sigma24 family protein